jgi:anti-anti-sigma regulatory factor
MALNLPADASESALELRDALVALLAESEPLILNGGSVRRISTASLQILLGAINAAEQGGIPTRWESVSPALHEAAGCLGLATALQLPSAGGAGEDLENGKHTGG